VIQIPESNVALTFYYNTTLPFIAQSHGRNQDLTLGGAKRPSRKTHGIQNVGETEESYHLLLESQMFNPNKPKLHV
jgi:hypothetical protein